MTLLARPDTVWPRCTGRAGRCHGENVLKPQKTPAYGAAGKKRVAAYYRQETMMEKYRALYEEVVNEWQESDLN